MSPEPTFTARQLSGIVGVTYRQLDYWARTDLLRPSISEARGSGTQRRYSFEDARVALGVRKALDAGLSLQSVRGATGYLRDPEGCDLLYVATNGAIGVCAADGVAITEAVRDCGGLLTIVDISVLDAEIHAGLHRTDAGRSLVDTATDAMRTSWGKEAS